MIRISLRQKGLAHSGCTPRELDQARNREPGTAQVPGRCSVRFDEGQLQWILRPALE